MNNPNLETHLLWESLINSNNKLDIGPFVEAFNNLFFKQIKQIKEEELDSDFRDINDAVLREQWPQQSNQEQTDDIIVIGVKI